MKDVKYVPFRFLQYLYKGVEEYLNEQAARGWALESFGLLLAKFRRTDRADLKYNVDLIPRDEEYRREYFALCGGAGWELVGTQRMAAVFVSRPGENPAPVQTDPEVERDNFRRAIRLDLSVSGVILLLAIVFFAWLSAQVGGFRFTMPDDPRDAAFLICITVCMALILTVLILQGVSLLALWHTGWGRSGAPVPPRWALRCSAAADTLFLPVFVFSYLARAVQFILQSGMDPAMCIGVGGIACIALGLVSQRDGRPLQGWRQGLVAAGAALLLLTMIAVTVRDRLHLF